MHVILWNGGIPWGISRTVGPYKLAHWLRKNNYQSQVIDFIEKIPEEWLYKTTKRFITAETIVLGISTTFLAWNMFTHSNGKQHRLPESAFNVLYRLKKEHPNIKIVTGGYQSEKMNGWGLVDATIMTFSSSESSEDIFVEYLDYLSKGSAPPHSTENQWDKRPIYDKARNTKYNIEVDDFKFTQQDCILPNEPLPLEVSRGCIFACKFCQYPHIGKKKFDYIRGMEFLEEELRSNYDNFGTTTYYLVDDTFNDSEFKLTAFHNMVKRLPFDIKYITYLRADLIHRFPDMTSLLEDSGLFGAFFGIETLHPEASKIIGKAWSGTHAREYIPKLYHDIWKGQIPVQTNFIVGFTGDDHANISSTVDWFIQNKLHSIVFQKLGLHGPDKSPVYTVKSELDKNPSKYGYTIIDIKSDSNVTPSANWKNAVWTRDTATREAERANQLVYPYQKITTWVIPSKLWYGATEEAIKTINLKDWPTLVKIDEDQIVKEKIKYYINLLMGV